MIMNEIPGVWLNLRKQAEMDGFLLSEAVFEQAREIFLDKYLDGNTSPVSITREYLHDEFLLVVDEEGNASGTSEKILNSFRVNAAEYPQFGKWFVEVVSPLASPAKNGGDQRRVLLAARWLCHLIGLRHGTVEIFLDPPHLDDHTLVQVRGLEKFEAPGAFDIPCAGHISGTDSVEGSLAKELAEELALTLDDLHDLRLLKQYNSYTGGGVKSTANHEHRVLYRARLKSSAAERIRFQDGEVAGLAVFSLPELREMISIYPDRIASGLSDAIDFYC
jgi:isopentenyldiphosphate isomerase